MFVLQICIKKAPTVILRQTIYCIFDQLALLECLIAYNTSYYVVEIIINQYY